MIRTFIAIEIPLEIKHTLRDVQNALKRERMNAKWVNPDNIHITLRFIGDVQESQIDTISEAMRNATKGVNTFTTSINGIGLFPNLGKPRVLWTGIEKGQDELTQLAESINNELQTIGIEKNPRRFKPHVTIARFHQHEKYFDVSQYYNIVQKTLPRQFQTLEIKLIKSELRPEGARYTNLAVSNLIIV